METLHIRNTVRNKSHRSVQVHFVLTFVGIVTAFICSLVLLKDIHSGKPSKERAPRSMEAPKFAGAKLLVNAASTLVVIQ